MSTGRLKPVQTVVELRGGGGWGLRPPSTLKVGPKICLGRVIGQEYLDVSMVTIL